MSTTTFNSHPIFEANQVLTHSQLNTLRNYLDEQTRLSRTKLIGMGIVCGFEVSYISAADATGGEDTIFISKGNGITSQGFLITECDCSTKYVRSYQLPTGMEYDAFDNLTDPLYELLTKQSNNPDPSERSLTDFIAETGNNLDDYYVVLFLECFDNDLKSCLGKSCDDIGIERLYTLRKLLVTGTNMDQILANTSNTGGTLYPDKFNLPNLSMPRVLFDPAQSHSQNYTDFSLNYIDAFNNDNVGSGDDIYVRLFGSNATGANTNGLLHQTYEIFKPILEQVYDEKFGGNPFDFSTIKSQISDWEDYFYNISSPGPAYFGIQYFYDFIKDIIKAYLEFRDAAYELMSKCTCCGDQGLFERHLMLGEVIPLDDCKPSVYRQVFIPTPIFNNQQQLIEKVIVLHKRIVLMVENLNLDRINNPGAALDILITPSCEKKGLLGDRAIPFYYDIDGITGDSLGSLEENWNHDITRKCQPAENGLVLSYHNHDPAITSPITTPLLFDMDPFNFFRIEGHFRKNPLAVIDQLKQLKETFDLPFDLVALTLDTYPKPDLNNITIDYDCCFEDIHEEYHIYRNRFAGFMQDIVTILKEIQEAIVIETGKEAMTGEIDPIDFLDDVIEGVEEFIALLPPCIKDFDYEAFKAKYRAGIQTIIDLVFFDIIKLEDIFCALNQLEDAIEIDINQTKLDMAVKLLYRLFDTFFYVRLLKLSYAFKRREYFIKAKVVFATKEFIFSNYLKKQPGPEHMAGVPPGGTFIIVYHNNGTEPEPMKVIADFALPYRCCNDCCMPVCDDLELKEGIQMPPFARPELAVTKKDTAVDIYVLDTDENLYLEDHLELVFGTGMTDTVSDEGGTITISTPETGQEHLNYTPPQGFIGWDQFQYSVRNIHNGLTDSALVTVLVRETDCPNCLDLDNDKLIVGTGPGSLVGTFTSTDCTGAGGIGTEEEREYELVDGPGDTHNFRFNIQNRNQLITNDNFTVEETLSIRVQVSDKYCCTYEQVFNIFVEDIDFILDDTTIIENRPVNTVVGNLLGTKGTPPFNFTLVSGNAEFNIPPGGSQLRSSVIFDFETPPNTYPVDIQVQDGSGFTRTKQFTIQVLDENEAPTVNPATFIVNKSAQNGDQVGQVTATDPENTTVTFAISPANSTFAIDTNTGWITVADPTDLNNFNTFLLNVVGTDAGGLTHSATITILVNQPPVVNPPKTFNIATSATIVGTVTATDPEGDTNIGYRFTAGATNLFAINSTSGQITVIGALTGGVSHPMTLEVADSSGSAGTDTITINVAQANQAPTINNKDDIFTIARTAVTGDNVTGGATGGIVSATDPEGDALTYVISKENGGASVTFTFDAATPGQLEVADPALLANTNSFILDIIVTDTSGASDSGTFRVNVTDSAASVTNIDFTLTLRAEPVLENLTPGVIGNFRSVDGSAYTYVLATSSVVNNNDQFSLLSSGELSANTRLSGGSYTVTVQGGTALGTTIKDFTILVIASLDPNPIGGLPSLVPFTGSELGLIETSTKLTILSGAGVDTSNLSVAKVDQAFSNYVTANGGLSKVEVESLSDQDLINVTKSRGDTSVGTGTSRTNLLEAFTKTVRG